MPPSPVGPITSTTVPLVYDSDAGGFGGPVDMTGPVVGSVSYQQNGASALELAITVDFGQPGANYEVFLTCGPAHSLACGFASVGTLTTNVAGSGSATIAVPLGVLLGTPFGPGYRTDHLDLLDPAAGFAKGALTAGAVNYFVCRRRPVGAEGEGEAQAEEQQAQPPQAATGEGDPLASMATATSQDPLTAGQG
jgi:hypothetical protein